jgi:hypothetical protein
MSLSIVLYNILPSSHCLVQLDAGRKLSQLRQVHSILVQNQFECFHEPVRLKKIDDYDVLY